MVPTSGDIKLPEDVVKFVCPHCRRKLSATPIQYGTEMPCPHKDCAQPVQVPDPAGDNLKGLYD